MPVKNGEQGKAALMQATVRARIGGALAIIVSATLLGIVSIPPVSANRWSHALVATLAGPVVPLIQFWEGRQRVFYAPSLFGLILVETAMAALIIWHWKRKTIGSFAVAVIFWAVCGLLFGVVIWI